MRACPPGSLLLGNKKRLPTDHSVRRRNTFPRYHFCYRCCASLHCCASLRCRSLIPVCRTTGGATGIPVTGESRSGLLSKDLTQTARRRWLHRAVLSPLTVRELSENTSAPEVLSCSQQYSFTIRFYYNAGFRNVKEKLDCALFFTASFWNQTSPTHRSLRSRSGSRLPAAASADPESHRSSH